MCDMIITLNKRYKVHLILSLIKFTFKGNNPSWFSKKTKPKEGYHFRKILELKVGHFQKIAAEFH